MHMQIRCLTSSGCSLFTFSIGGLWIICSCFGIFLILLYCFPVFIILHYISLYTHLPHLVEEEAFPLLLRLANVHLCGFSVLISGILFPFTYICDAFPSFLHSPPSYLLLVLPSNSSWSSIQQEVDSTTPTLLHGVFMWGGGGRSQPSCSWLVKARRSSSTSYLTVLWSRPAHSGASEGSFDEVIGDKESDKDGYWSWGCKRITLIWFLNLLSDYLSIQLMTILWCTLTSVIWLSRKLTFFPNPPNIGV